MDKTETTELLTKEQLGKLPLWAQHAYKNLAGEARNLRHENDALRAALGEAPLDGASGLVTWSVLMDDYLLPDNAGARFYEAGQDQPGHNRYIEVGYRKSDLGQGKRVVYIQGSEGLVIRPLAANVVAIRLRRRDEDD